MGVEMTYLPLQVVCCGEPFRETDSECQWQGQLVVSAWVNLNSPPRTGYSLPSSHKGDVTDLKRVQGTAQCCTGTTHSAASTTTQTCSAFPLDHISFLEEQGGCVKNHYTDLSNPSPELAPHPPHMAVTSFTDHGYGCLLSGLVSKFI